MKRRVIIEGRDLICLVRRIMVLSYWQQSEYKLCRLFKKRRKKKGKQSKGKKG